MTAATGRGSPGAVHRPVDAAGVAEVVRSAAADGRPLRIRGGGTWMDVGLPVRADETLDLGALGGIDRYTPDDLTISVGAAVTLAELDAVTRARNQWCPLLPWGDDAGTVGATIATATSGPFAAALGRPRDLVLGIDCVDGLGRVVRAGGRVVKNVAGFDLTRLMTGQWGTLGVITALHLRLRARPAVDESFEVSCGAGQDAAVREFAAGGHAPMACVAHAGRWLVRLGGNRASVDAALADLGRCGDVVPVDHDVWNTIRRDAAPPPRANVWRWDTLSQRLKKRFDPAQVLNRGLLGEPS